MKPSKPAVSIAVHAEPESEPVFAGADDVAWLVLWQDGTVERYNSARALLREVRRRDRRDAARA